MVWFATAGVALVGFAIQDRASDCLIHLAPDSSIQEAIDTAPDRAVLCLGPGTYRVNLEIGSGLTIRGETGSPSDVMIVGMDEGPVVSISSQDHGEVILENLTLEGAVGEYDAVGLLVHGNATVRLEEVVIRDNASHGVIIEQNASLELLSVQITANGRLRGLDGLFAIGNAAVSGRGCSITHSGNDGVHAEGEASLEFEDCEISKNDGPALDLGDSAKLIAIDCVMARNRYFAVEVRQSSRVTLLGCSISWTDGDGIRLRESGYLTMENTRVVRNTGYGVCAVSRECTGVRPGERTFSGRVDGQGNTVFTNSLGDFCPQSLKELLTGF
jgi:hypothetical protein